jgi:hypothetical protein
VKVIFPFMGWHAGSGTCCSMGIDWKSPTNGGLMGKSPINAGMSIAMVDYWRVPLPPSTNKLKKKLYDISLE